MKYLNGNIADNPWGDYVFLNPRSVTYKGEPCYYSPLDHNGATSIKYIRSGARQPDPWPAINKLRHGKVAHNFIDDFYNRLHASPALLNLGNITEDRIVSINIYSAYLKPVSVDSIVGSGTEGMILDTRGNMPINIRPLTSYSFSVTVTTSGPASIDAEYFITCGASPAIPHRINIKGDRAVIFGFGPDWNQPVTEKFVWLTDVLTSHGGKEQRIKMREHPRWSLSYEILSGQTPNLGQFDALISGWGGRSFLLPMWHKGSELTGSVLEGSRKVPCRGRDLLSVGEQIVVWQDPLKNFTGLIKEIHNDSLVLRDGAACSIHNGFVFPARMCRLNGEVVRQNITSDMFKASVRFISTDSFPNYTSMETDEKYNGVQVFPYKHNFYQPQQHSYNRQFIEYDNGLGVEQWIDRYKRPVETTEVADIMLKSQKEISSFVSWLYSVSGQLKPFYIRPEENHTHLSRYAKQGAKRIYLAYTQWLGISRHLKNRSILALLCKNKWIYLKAIGGITDPAGDIAIDLADELPLGLNPHEVGRITFLKLVRLNTDEVEIKWQTRRNAKVSLPLLGVER